LSTVSYVVKNQLCTGCGTCKSVCPTSAIDMRISSDKSIYEPLINESKCIKCKICYNVCPGHSINFFEMNQEFFLQQPSEPWIGNFLGCYLGHSNVRQIRYNSTSGGIVTQLLVYLLENDLIDGALVTRMNNNNPLKPEPFIARTKREIIKSATSKYCPVPVNIGLKQLLIDEGKFAVVGLPCHIHGIRKAEKIFNDLKNKIYLHIGLFCSHMVNLNGTKFILKKNRINISKIKSLYYRGRGWPGSMTINMKDGSKKIIPYVKKWNSYWPVFSSYFFTPMRCMMCSDITAEMADISVGDAWLPELKNDKIGKSIIVTRNKISDNLLNKMLDEGILYIKEIHQNDIARSQDLNVKFKKVDLGNRLSFLESNYKKIPYYYPPPKNYNSFIQKLRNIFIINNVQLSTKNIFMNYFVNIPFPIFRFYSGINKILYELDK